MIHTRPDYIRFQEPALYDKSLLGEGCTPIAIDEPVFLLRAQDAFFIPMLEEYLYLLESCGTEQHMIESVQLLKQLALDWREHNPPNFPTMPKG